MAAENCGLCKALICLAASTQMTESPINTNTINSRIRVEDRVTRPSRSTPTERRYMMVTRGDEER